MRFLLGNKGGFDISRIKISYEESHKINNGVLEKLCNRCWNWFPCTDEFFHRNIKTPDKLFPYCKKCNVKISSESQEENKEFRTEYMREYYQNNTEIMIENAKRANRSKPEHYKKKQKEYRQNHKEQFNKYTKKYSNKKHTISTKEWEICLEYFNYKCAYCGISQKKAKEIFGQNLHREHVDYDGSSGIENCVPACKQCNSEKHQDKLEIWYNETNPKFTYNKFNKILQWINEGYKKTQ